ncbi:MAG: rod shape-determining protein MreD [Clostridia bacterium]|nr:rod shape-determining protein MreD [Clostridia bacterium]
MTNHKNSHFHRRLQFFLLGLLLVMLWSLQIAPANLFEIGSVRPVPTVVLTICVGILYGETAGGVFGLFAGLLMDTYTTPTVAFHVVLLTALGIFCGLAVKHLFMNNRFSWTVLWFVGSLLYFIFYWLLFKVILGNDGFSYLLYYSLPGALYTGAWGIVLHPLVWSIRRWC